MSDGLSTGNQWMARNVLSKRNWGAHRPLINNKLMSVSTTEQSAENMMECYIQTAERINNNIKAIIYGRYHIVGVHYRIKCTNDDTDEETRKEASSKLKLFIEKTLGIFRTLSWERKNLSTFSSPNCMYSILREFPRIYRLWIVSEESILKCSLYYVWWTRELREPYCHTPTETEKTKMQRNPHPLFTSTETHTAIIAAQNGWWTWRW